MERHIEDAKEDHEENDLVGLLVYNHRRERPPQERQLNPSNFRDDLIEKEQKLLTTVDLYHLLNKCSQGEVVREDVEALLENDGPIISVDPPSVDSDRSAIEELLETIESGKERVIDSLRRY